MADFASPGGRALREGEEEPRSPLFSNDLLVIVDFCAPSPAACFKSDTNESNRLINIALVILQIPLVTKTISKNLLLGDSQISCSILPPKCSLLTIVG